ncbi:MAG: DUF262 domain-containing protein [Pseudomonadota bacterium]
MISSQFIEIPPFQRPYTWRAEHVEQLWEDLVRAKGTDYFVGSLVFYDHPRDPAVVFVTDGQQRLTTLTITMCVLRDICRELGIDNIASGIQNLIERPDIDNEKRFFIKVPTTNKFLANKIFSEEDSIVEPRSDEEKLQNQAYRQIRKLFIDYLEVNLGSSWKSDDNTEKKIIEIRDTIFGMSFIQLTLENEEEAYIISETLNSRGMDLEVSDLLKSLFSRRIKKPNKDISHVTIAWDEIRGRFQGLQNTISFDNFLLHYWLSKYSFVSKKDLFKSMKQYISKQKSKEALDDIVLKSKSYAKLSSPDDFPWSKEER